MSYIEILNKTTNRILTQFEPHAILALGQGTVVNGATATGIALPAFSCVATDIVIISNFTSSAVQALGNPLRSAIIAVDGAGIPTLNVTLAAQNAGAAIVFNYTIYRAAN
jgi:hypothetical protein